MIAEDGPAISPSICIDITQTIPTASGRDPRGSHRPTHVPRLRAPEDAAPQGPCEPTRKVRAARSARVWKTTDRPRIHRVRHRLRERARRGLEGPAEFDRARRNSAVVCARGRVRRAWVVLCAVDNGQPGRALYTPAACAVGKDTRLSEEAGAYSLSQAGLAQAGEMPLQILASNWGCDAGAVPACFRALVTTDQQRGVSEYVVNTVCLGFEVQLALGWRCYRAGSSSGSSVSPRLLIMCAGARAVEPARSTSVWPGC